MIPTFRSAETIERTLTAALAQRHRPLEVLVYDETSEDGTREIVTRLLAAADPTIETHFRTSESNSGAVPAWRVLLHDVTGDWCCFVWADDVLKPDFSERMMEGAERAAAAGRVLVACSGEVEAGGQTVPYYSADKGIATAVEYSEGMFLRRIPLTQICAVYETAAARAVFDRHIRFENPRGYDYVRHPYGNDVGFLSELAMEGGGVELLGERLVTLVDSSTSMTRTGTGDHIWQMRWQYTYASRASGPGGRSVACREPTGCSRWPTAVSRSARSCSTGRAGLLRVTQLSRGGSGVPRVSSPRLPAPPHHARRAPHLGCPSGLTLSTLPLCRRRASKALSTRSTCRACGSSRACARDGPRATSASRGRSDAPGEDRLAEPRLPLQLVRCDRAANPEGCGLLQLRHTVPGSVLYSSYWYRSGINRTMTENLHEIARGDRGRRRPSARRSRDRHRLQRRHALRRVCRRSG